MIVSKARIQAELKLILEADYEPDIPEEYKRYWKGYRDALCLCLGSPPLLEINRLPWERRNG